MKNTCYWLLLTLSIWGCQDAIKNDNAEVKVEEGTAIIPSEKKTDEEKEILLTTLEKDTVPHEDLIGFWVGYFEEDSDNAGEHSVYVGEGYMWNRANKINISIDNIVDTLVTGHSVVAGNDRPFTGKIERLKDSSGYYFSVKEPGDDRYDGAFEFTISNRQLNGKWNAYRNIQIRNRKYDLRKTDFEYDPDIVLERSKAYVNWNQFIEKKEWANVEDEFAEWVTKEFATASDLIYEINASNAILEKSAVENLKRGDLTIIRNTIYARHGYSFKNRPLRVFFDAQDWYIPVHTNIKADFTDIEKQNIELLLRYEKNAAAYYDSFGRG